MTNNELRSRRPPVEGRETRARGVPMPRRSFRSGLPRLLRSKLSASDIAQVNAEVGRDVLSIKLAELRRIMNVTQREIKGFSQPAVASLEKRKDMKISTLAHYISEIGMGMEIKVLPKRKSATARDEMVLLRV